MKKVLFFAMGLASVAALAQTDEQFHGRIGINIEKPRATMDIVGRPITDEDKNFSRGVILPHISEAQKLQFTDKTEGLMIWNTTKKCIDYWDSTKWQCLGEATNNTPPEKSFISTKTAEYTASFNKSSCTADNFTNFPKPTPYTQIATATATSNVSQEEADRLALEKATQEAKNKVNAGGQAYADTNGECKDYRNLRGICRVSYIDNRGYYIIGEENLLHPEFSMCYGGAFEDARRLTNNNFDFNGNEHGSRVKVEARFYPNDKSLPSYGWFVYQTRSGWDLTDNHYLMYEGTFEPQQ